MYSSKVMSVLDWVLRPGQDFIVYSEVHCFQVTVALMGLKSVVWMCTAAGGVKESVQKLEVLLHCQPLCLIE